MTFWTGDEWRWDVSKHPTPRRTSLDVIEPKEARDIPKDARRVPFGFSRALEAETIAGLEEFDRRHDDGWAAHAEALVG